MKVKLEIQNLDRTIEAEVGEDLRTALLENDIEIYAGLYRITNCRGKAICASCRVEVVDGPGLSDQSLYERVRIGPHLRLACQARIYKDTVIRTLVTPQEFQD